MKTEKNNMADKLFYLIIKVLYNISITKTKNINKLYVIESILQRKEYIEQSYKGGDLYMKGFCFVIIDTNSKEIVIGTDVNSNKKNRNGSMIKNYKLTDFLIALNYFERINIR